MALLHAMEISNGVKFEDLVQLRTPDHHLLPNLFGDDGNEDAEEKTDIGENGISLLQGDRTVNLNNPVDAISANRQQTMIVAAGSRGVLQIFKVSDERIEHVIDLRSLKSKRLNLTYSPSNVAWSKVNDELIATSSNNGAVVLWHTERGRLEHTYKVHTRSATVVNFHRSDANLLISGSKDSNIILYDLRRPDPVQIYRSGVLNTVRDLSFCLHSGQRDFFLSADEYGQVKVWDMRMGDKPVTVYKPHQGYASSIALNPKEPQLVASGGGRDKLIKVWNWCLGMDEGQFPLFQVETIAPVGRVYWRPNHPWQVASCAVVNDMSVLVWDVRRPHVPVVSFEGHRDSVTDIWWNEAHPHRFVTSGKDGLIKLHNFIEGSLTLDHLCDTPIDVAPDGLIATAVNSQIHLKNLTKWESLRSTLQLNVPADRERMKRSAAIRRAVATARRQNEYDPHRGPVLSNMSVGVPSTALRSLQPIVFAQLAEEYAISGASVSDICQWNSRVASRRGLHDRAETWRYIAVLIAQTDFQQVYDQEARDREEAEKKKWEVYIREQVNQGVWPWLQPKRSAGIRIRMRQYKHGGSSHLGQQICQKNLKTFTTHFPSFLDTYETFDLLDPVHFDTLSDGTTVIYVPSGLPLLSSADLYFGPGELRGFAATGIEEPPCNDFFGLPQEAFQLKPHLNSSKYLDVANFTSKDGWLAQPNADWNPLEVLSKTLSYLAEQGDMQMCALVTLICGYKISTVISDFKTEVWQHAYLEMLDRLEMYIESAELRKLTWIKRLREKTSESTFHKEEIYHMVPAIPSSNPNKRNEITIAGQRYHSCTGQVKQGRCDECHTAVQPPCILCDEEVQGQVWCCPRCNHSMHADHAIDWFREAEPTDSDSSDSDSEVEEPYIQKDRLHCPVSWCDCRCNFTYHAATDLDTRENMLSERIAPATDNHLYSTAASVLFHYEDSDDSDVDEDSAARITVQPPDPITEFFLSEINRKDSDPDLLTQNVSESGRRDVPMGDSNDSSDSEIIDPEAERRAEEANFLCDQLSEEVPILAEQLRAVLLLDSDRCQQLYKRVTRDRTDRSYSLLKARTRELVSYVESLPQPVDALEVVMNPPIPTITKHNGSSHTDAVKLLKSWPLRNILKSSDSSELEQKKRSIVKSILDKKPSSAMELDKQQRTHHRAWQKAVQRSEGNVEMAEDDEDDEDPAPVTSPLEDKATNSLQPSTENTLQRQPIKTRQFRGFGFCETDSNLYEDAEYVHDAIIKSLLIDEVTSDVESDASEDEDNQSDEGEDFDYSENDSDKEETRATLDWVDAMPVPRVLSELRNAEQRESDMVAVALTFESNSSTGDFLEEIEGSEAVFSENSDYDTDEDDDSPSMFDGLRLSVSDFDGRGSNSGNDDSDVIFG